MRGGPPPYSQNDGYSAVTQRRSGVAGSSRYRRNPVLPLSSSPSTTISTLARIASPASSASSATSMPASGPLLFSAPRPTNDRPNFVSTIPPTNGGTDQPSAEAGMTSYML